MSGSFNIGRIRGIAIKLHYTWLFALVFVGWSLAEGYYPSNFPQFDPVTDWVLGMISALLLFASVLIHELSHSVVAMARGLRVYGITRFIFGGVSEIAGEPREPKDEFAISLAGPLMSLGLAVSFWIILGMIGPAPSPANALTAYLAFVNLALAVFNLVPGFPLDGGRVLRSVLWAITHSLRRATSVASFVGRACGFILIGWGLVQVLSGDFFSGIWTAFLGWFLNNAAEATRHMDLEAQRPLLVVPTDRRLSDALQLLGDEGFNEIWVTDEGCVVGLVRRAEAARGPEAVAWGFKNIPGAGEIRFDKQIPLNGLEKGHAA
jgi:Zn-dependent protease